MTELNHANDSINNLRIEREKIENQIKEIQKLNKKQAVEEIVTIMKTFDVSIKNVSRKVLNQKPIRKVAPKVMHTVTGATWSGRGKTPRWYKEDWQNVVKL